MSAANLSLWLHQKMPGVKVYPLNGKFASHKVLRNNIEYLMKKGVPARDIMIVYFGHGFDNTLVGDESLFGHLSGPMVQIGQDLNFLKDTTIVAIACLSAKKLGPYLHSEVGVARYFGFTEEVLVDRGVQDPNKRTPSYKTKRVLEDTVDIYTYIPKALLHGEAHVLSSYKQYLNTYYANNDIGIIAHRSSVLIG